MTTTGAMMTDKQMQRELSREYLEWVETPDLNIVPAVEEIERLCRVVVGLRKKLRAARVMRFKKAGAR
jgi:hypothetical protein